MFRNLKNMLSYQALCLMNRRIGFIFIASLSLFISCKDPKVIPEENKPGKIVFYFNEVIDDEPISYDTLIYENAAGNPYLVNEIQYFISDVTLYKNDGSEKVIDDWKDIHYVDTDIPETKSWQVYDDINTGTYDSIAFTFGISPEKNQSFMFVNPPEKDMFWPEYLGGGYHYMKLNGKWLPAGQATETLPFDFHLGIGQIYYSYPDSIIGFIPNMFRVSLPGSSFSIENGQVQSFEITMHVENWFKDPHIYDHDVFGGYIMQNQEAMQMVKENGQNVFTFENLNFITDK